MKALKGLAYNFRVVNSGLVQTMADHRYESYGSFKNYMPFLSNKLSMT